MGGVVELLTALTYIHSATYCVLAVMETIEQLTSLLSGQEAGHMVNPESPGSSFLLTW